MSSFDWFEYERGRISQQDCYNRLGREFSLDPKEISSAFYQASQSLQSNDIFVSFIRELKTQFNGQLCILAMSNISLPDYEILKGKLAEWSIFDQIFTSGETGHRKPELGFYEHVIAKADLDATKTVFVDDKIENVLSACSLGLHGITFDTSKNVMRYLRNLFGDPVQRGQEFLIRNAGHLECATNTGATFLDNLSQLFVLEATGDRKLVDVTEPPRVWNFFHGKRIDSSNFSNSVHVDAPVLTTKEYPCDLDTTSVGWTVIKQDREIVSSIMDEMLQHVNSDGIIQVYLDHRRPRFDAVVCVNVLTFFFTHGRGSDLDRTLQWVHGVLLHRAYLNGTQYYANPEWFLFALTRLLGSSSDSELHRMFDDLLRERVQERIGAAGDALALAMRLVASAFVGVRNDIDLPSLLKLQCEDGGWEGWVYMYGVTEAKIGNRGLATALALKAIKAMHEGEYMS